jgi:hypothetical protein
MQSGVSIIPATELAAGDAFAAQMGWGEGVYSVALAPSSIGPITHYGCRADLYPSFMEFLANPPPDSPPFVWLVDEFDAEGNPLPIPRLPYSIIIHTREQGDAYGHWIDVTESQGLVTLLPDNPANLP